MRLFRRSETEPDLHPVTAFWRWWDDEGHRISPHRATSRHERLTSRITAIHPGLTWHFEPGVSSRHRLTVSAGGLAEARPSAERWLRAAPQADATWEFRSSQQADPDALHNILNIGGHEVDLASLRFRVDIDEARLRVHVGVHHPAFERIPEDVRAQISYMSLDWLLGEDDVERWLGRIEPLCAAPTPAQDPDALRTTVATIAAQRDPDTWVLGEWEGESGVPGFSCWRPGARWIDNPTLDRHQRISSPYRAREDGLPADAAVLDHLRQVESELESCLGSRGTLVGHETHRGERSFHVYTDGEDQNVDAALGQWSQDRGLRREATYDPGWSEVRHLTG